MSDAPLDTAPARPERIFIARMEAGAYGIFIDRPDRTIERHCNVPRDQVPDLVRQVLGDD